jgi:hypothetical protein
VRARAGVVSVLRSRQGEGAEWGLAASRRAVANGVRYAEPKTKTSILSIVVLKFSLPTVIEHSKKTLAQEKIFNGTPILRPVSALLEPSSVRLLRAIRFRLRNPRGLKRITDSNVRGGAACGAVKLRAQR